MLFSVEPVASADAVDAASSATVDGDVPDPEASHPRFGLGASTESEISLEGDKTKAPLRRQQETVSDTPSSKSFFLLMFLVFVCYTRY